MREELKAPASPPARNKRATTGSLLSELDLYLLAEGTHSRLYQKLGAHPVTPKTGPKGTHFGVWAPSAESVSVVGNFNQWKIDAHPLKSLGSSGVWEGFVKEIGPGEVYKYHIQSQYEGYQVQKADPFALLAEEPPQTASVVWAKEYDWKDHGWMQARRAANALDAPISVYEVHLGSWRRSPEHPSDPLSYRELAPLLSDYILGMGFTHVELMPCTEHPFYGSWGYQTTGYFAPTHRYGEPEELMFLIDHLHQNGIGVILDWVPSHFPSDEHGLAYFDGSHLYEHQDTRQGYHPDWDSLIFNYDRNEVQSFLLSSACFWLDQFHIDALRVDAVASMLYLDYSRKEGEWIPNEFGGRENIGAINFLRQLNTTIGRDFPGTQTIAEESTSWPMVSRPTSVGGLGFHLKWDMGWMHDTLKYMEKDPIHRRYHHGDLTFRMIYAFNENFVLALSHDEVVHGKGSLIDKMPGDDWQKFANLRLLYGYMFALPGKKLLFMGDEIAQRAEWNHEQSLDWHLLDLGPHQGMQHWVRDLNHTYQSEPALYQQDCKHQGFAWIDSHDSDNCVLSFLRMGQNENDIILAVCNFTPVVRQHYRLGIPAGFESWEVILNSDAEVYGGSGQGPWTSIPTLPVSIHGRPHCLEITVPPLSVMLLKPVEPTKVASPTIATEKKAR